MILWNKGKIKSKRIIDADLASINLDTQLETFEEERVIESSNLFAAFAPAAVQEYVSGCAYPMDISNQFPLWTAYKTDEDIPNLIDFTKAYFDWLTCGVQSDVSPDFGFFELENLKRINALSKQYLLLHSELYIPSLPKKALQEDVSEDELKTLLNGIYNKLYVKKGSEYSFKYLISLFFGVTSDYVQIIYPKRHLMILNSGANHEVNNINPLTTIGRLNYSVIKDNTIWNEYSYVVNVKKKNEYISRDRFENLIRPLLHPVGLKDYYQEQEELLSSLVETISIVTVEIPKIVNYFYYNMNSDSTIDRCIGCTFPAPENQPSFVFPNWSTKIPAGISFGLINISDFWELVPAIADNYPNNSINCTGCP